jgi:class 3 adenylate cyclase
MSAKDGADGRPRREHPVGWPIAFVLVGAITLVVVIAVAVTFLTGYGIARRNTHELIAERTELLVRSIVDHTRAYLDPVDAQLRYLTGLLSDGPLDLADREALGAVLRSSIAATPQVSVLALLYPDMTILRAFRDRRERSVTVDDWSGDPSVRRTLEHARGKAGVYWAELFVAERSGRTFINARSAITRDGRFAGTLIAAVSIEEFSTFVAGLKSDALGHAFILYGTDQVLAHPLLAERAFPVSDAAPLPRLADFPDPVLRLLWNEASRTALPEGLTRGGETHAALLDGETEVFRISRLEGYGERPWLIGTYQDLNVVAVQLDRLTIIPLIAIAIVLASIGLALLLARGLSQPIRQLAMAAQRVRELDLDRLRPLDHGRYRELSEAVRAYNAMLGALRAFQTYVPRGLVRRLVKADAPDRLRSEEREVTVLFTDIAGFTEYCEGLAPSEVAAFVNQHFALLDQCVEAEDGTVDKYIGDSLMAFWGAPERQADHAARACRAALRMQHAIRDDNRLRAAAGQRPVRLRIGIHSGPVLVGNIGAPSRVNYTVIGDTVNTAERLEAFAKNFPFDAGDMVALLSGETAARIGSEIACARLGRFLPPGRQQRVEVYRLPPGDLPGRYAAGGAAPG